MKGGKIMKKFTRTGKKVLSVFLAVLMVMTAWVFVAPEAEAATAGSYTVRVTFSMASLYAKTVEMSREPLNK